MSGDRRGAVEEAIGRHGLPAATRVPVALGDGGMGAAIRELESRTGRRWGGEPRLVLWPWTGDPARRDPRPIEDSAALERIARESTGRSDVALVATDRLAWASLRDAATGRRGLRLDGLPVADALPESVRRALERELVRLESEVEGGVEVGFALDEESIVVLGWRRGEPSPLARIRIAVDRVDEGAATVDGVLGTISPAGLADLLEGSFDPDSRAQAAREGRLLARGVSVAPGAVRGRLALDPEEVEAELALGRDERRPWILACEELGVEHVGAIDAAAGIVLAAGPDSVGATLAAELGTPCIASVEGLAAGAEAVRFAEGRSLEAGDWASLDASGGELYAGRVALLVRESGDLERVLRWADSRRRLAVRANVDALDDARRAISLGADGLGLVRTEHVLSAPGAHEDLRSVVRAILAGEPARPEALERLVRFQAAEFAWLLRLAGGRPVTIRLLDAPLHELFEPGDPVGHEANPMLGLRGPRLDALAPAIYDHQLSAIARATQEVRGEGRPVRVEVLVPLVSGAIEFERIAARARRSFPDRLDLAVGAMIEVPRAALEAGELARSADFLAFGTNDLTQSVLGLSRDDAGRVVEAWLSAGVLEADPFRVLDTAGVGRIVRAAVESARSVRPDLPIGVCGEQAADPATIRFLDDLGIDYVSCAPDRIPAARLAAAQARLKR